MTFREIVDDILADAFDEDKRADAKTWTNSRYGWVWDLESWSFKKAVDDVTVTAGSQTVSGLATDVLHVNGFVRDDGTPLHYLDPAGFTARFYDTTTSETGDPTHYTVRNGTVLVGPTPVSSSDVYRLDYEKKWTALSADSDEPLIPAQYHLALVMGGKATGWKLSNVPFWESFDQEFQAAIQTMRRAYLADTRGQSQQVPAYRPC